MEQVGKQININEKEFDDLLSVLDEVDMINDSYIPSDDDLLNFIEKHPERYYLYLLWYSEHKPKPQNEKEKMILKRISKIINNTINITFD